MNTTLAFEILELALALVQSKDANVAGTLLKIIQKGAEAYQQHTGKALDPSLIKAEDPV
jgi:hypothetical protein